MDLHAYLDHILHLNQYLPELVQTYGTLIYAILFAVIFCETGFVVTPFLPGDSLLFTVGALCGSAQLNIGFSWALLTAASLMGDHSNYWIGRFFGPNVFGKFVNKKYLDKTHEIYEKHGVQTLVLFQFAPIFRTFAPFVAGIGHMTYAKFFRYNLIGVLLWTTICLGAGYLLGNLEFFQKHFELVILVIIFVSLIPTFLQVAKAFMGTRGGTSRSQAGAKKRKK
ncbi:MAG TPA: VTT domain-containing protein [bacterium]|nr:VTT domain-containing protein [bacterium]